MDGSYMEKLIVYLKYKYRLDNDDIEEYVDSFNTINQGADIDAISLREFIMDEIAGDLWTIDECKKIICTINGNTKCSLDLKTYLLYFIPICQEYVVTRIGIREIFNNLDTNYDDKLSRDEFISFLYRLNTNFTPENLPYYKKQIKELCDKIDENHDNYISYDEFKKFILEMGLGSVSPIKQNPEKVSKLQKSADDTIENLSINLTQFLDDKTKKKFRRPRDFPNRKVLDPLTERGPPGSHKGNLSDPLTERGHSVPDDKKNRQNNEIL